MELSIDSVDVVRGQQWIVAVAAWEFLFGPDRARFGVKKKLTGRIVDHHGCCCVRIVLLQT